VNNPFNTPLNGLISAVYFLWQHFPLKQKVRAGQFIYFLFVFLGELSL